jgi:hypothetical protein
MDRSNRPESTGAYTRIQIFLSYLTFTRELRRRRRNMRVLIASYKLFDHKKKN